MESLPSSFPGSAGTAVGLRPSRQHCRHRLMNVSYVNIDHANGGIIRDLSEAGAAIQAVTALTTGQEVHLRFELLQPRLRMETSARVCWADPNGQAGVQFAALPQRSRRQLQDWLLTQLLLRAHATFAENSIFNSENERLAVNRNATTCMQPGQDLLDDTDLPFARRVAPETSFSLFRSQGALSSVVDGLILLAAVLLFAIIAIAMIHDVPQWPVSAIVAGTATIIFSSSYWFLSLGWMGMTPGVYLLRAATGEYEGLPDRPSYRQHRFR